MTLMMFRGDIFLIFDQSVSVAFLYTTAAFIVGKFGYQIFRKYYRSKLSEKGSSI